MLRLRHYTRLTHIRRYWFLTMATLECFGSAQMQLLYFRMGPTDCKRLNIARKQMPVVQRACKRKQVMKFLDLTTHLEPCCSQYADKHATNLLDIVKIAD